MPLAYYNDIDPYCCQWLQNLIDAGLIPPGFVDNRSIVDIQPHEISRYRQVHLFAGLGGWAYALQLAGWP
ncbi:MAG: DNA cytosine methyltransferase, partial [Anaerolineae bacterium]|nr:DNA cytosine methyltransferase [Anaerolineae bacterium]